MRRLNNIIVGITVTLIILAVLALVGYWFFYLRVQYNNATPMPTPTGATSGFVPLNVNTQIPAKTETKETEQTTVPIEKIVTAPPVPALRLLSSTPVGGYGASTTASSTVVRWIDRGRGNVYQADSQRLDIETVSNTLLPRVYRSWWNKNDMMFIGQYLGEKTDDITTVIANITKRATSTQDVSPYQLKGKKVSGEIIAIAPSPKRDRVLMITNEKNRAIGYISNFDGTKQTQVFDLPFTQLTADWPEENTIAITTKAGSVYAGYLYFINVKTGAMTQILGDIPGLATAVSKDATRVLYSATGNASDKIETVLYDVKKKEHKEVLFRALADKCVWASKIKEQVYCGVATQIPSGTYPDDWYLGKQYFVDGIWLYDAKTEDVSEIANLLKLGNAIIDVFNLSLDNKDEFLFFINKNDLSLWSLNLLSTN